MKNKPPFIYENGVMFKWIFLLGILVVVVAVVMVDCVVVAKGIYLISENECLS